MRVAGLLVPWSRVMQTSYDTRPVCGQTEAMKLQKYRCILEVGKFADIIAIDGDPLSNITVLQHKNNIRMVMKEGKVYVDKLRDKPLYVIHPQPGSIRVADAS